MVLPRMLLALLLPGLAAAAVADTTVAAPPSDVAGVTAASASSTIQKANTCCAALKQILGDKVSLPSSCAYKSSLKSYWTLQESNIRPGCVVTPRSAQDVSLAVFLLNIGSTISPGQCNFAVRSGGHTPFAGAANIEGGITIDLKLVNQVSVANDRKTVTIGPGNRWDDVYKVTDPLGLAVLGGRISTVGVGGLVTGGGFSNFSPRFGLVCDQVESFEVVLASGRIVTATAQTNADLWRALRGGSNNFGIVTAFKMRAFDQGPYWGGMIITDGTAVNQQFAALEELTASPEYDPYAAMILNLIWMSPAADQWGTLMSPSYTKTNTPGDPLPPPALQNLTSTPGQLVNTMRVGRSGDFARDLNSPIGQRQLFVTATFRNSAAIMSAVFEQTKAAAQPWRQVPGIALSVAFQPEPSVISRQSAASGGNVLGLSESDGNLLNLLVTITWNEAADDALIEGTAKTLFDQFAATAQQLGVAHPYLYLNYAAKWQDPIAGYGAANKAFLQSVSKKYDPQGRFQKNVPGGFKLF